VPMFSTFVERSEPSITSGYREVPKELLRSVAASQIPHFGEMESRF
jgi:hypothetical protein